MYTFDNLSFKFKYLNSSYLHLLIRQYLFLNIIKLLFCEWGREWKALGYTKALHVVYLLTKSKYFLNSTPKKETRKNKFIIKKNKVEINYGNELIDKELRRKNSSRNLLFNNNNGNALNNNRRGGIEENGVEKEEEEEEEEEVEEEIEEDEKQKKHKEKEEENRKKYLNHAIEIIFADDLILKNFTLNYWRCRFLQIQCISNFFYSEDIDTIKQRVCPLFGRGIADVDFRVRILVARYVRTCMEIIFIL